LPGLGRADAKQFDDLGGALEGIGDRRRAVQRKRDSKLGPGERQQSVSVGSGAAVQCGQLEDRGPIVIGRAPDCDWVVHAGLRLTWFSVAQK